MPVVRRIVRGWTVSRHKYLRIIAKCSGLQKTVSALRTALDTAIKAPPVAVAADDSTFDRDVSRTLKRTSTHARAKVSPAAIQAAVDRIAGEIENCPKFKIMPANERQANDSMFVVQFEGSVFAAPIAVKRFLSKRPLPNGEYRECAVTNGSDPVRSSLRRS